MKNLSYIFLIKPEKATDTEHYPTDFDNGYWGELWRLQLVSCIFSVPTMLGAYTSEKLPTTHTDVCGSCQKGFYLDSSITANQSLICFPACLRDIQIHVALLAACKAVPGTEETLCLRATCTYLWNSVEKKEREGFSEEVLPSKVVAEETGQRTNLSQTGLKSNYAYIIIDSNRSS